MLPHHCSCILLSRYIPLPVKNVRVFWEARSSRWLILLRLVFCSLAPTFRGCHQRCTHTSSYLAISYHLRFKVHSRIQNQAFISLIDWMIRCRRRACFDCCSEQHTSGHWRQRPACRSRFPGRKSGAIRCLCYRIRMARTQRFCCFS